MATRRQFLGSTLLGGIAAALLPGSARGSAGPVVTAAPASGPAAAAVHTHFRRSITMAAAAQASSVSAEG